MEQVKYLAELEDRSLSSYINLVLREHLKELEKKKRLKAAKIPLDRGRKLAYNKQSQSIDREQYPAAGHQREGGR